MNRSLLFLTVICWCLLSAVPLIAQTPPMPPAVLNIFREEIKAGRNAAHENVETGYVRAFAQAKWPNNWLAMTTVSGANEAWYMSPYDSFAALEKDRQSFEKTSALLRQAEQLDQQDAEFRTGQRTQMAVFRKELSYHPERLMPDLPKARYFNVLTVRMRPGHDVEFNQVVRMYLDALEKANIEGGSAAYQVISGAQGGTYLIFTAVKSLAEMDNGPVRERAINEALGMENGQKLLKLISDSFLSSENTLFAFSPKMSYVSKDFAAGDPAYWTPKPKAVPKKPVATKPATTQ